LTGLEGAPGWGAGCGAQSRASLHSIRSV